MSPLAALHTLDDGRARCQRGEGFGSCPDILPGEGMVQKERTRRAKQNVNTSKFQNNVWDGTWSQFFLNLYLYRRSQQNTHMHSFSVTLVLYSQTVTVTPAQQSSSPLLAEHLQLNSTKVQMFHSSFIKMLKWKGCEIKSYKRLQRYRLHKNYFDHKKLFLKLHINKI